jgi:hypothetical protein
MLEYFAPERAAFVEPELEGDGDEESCIAFSKLAFSTLGFLDTGLLSTRSTDHTTTRQGSATLTLTVTSSCIEIR